jgi:Tfp pilus assembly protein PilP
MMANRSRSRLLVSMTLAAFAVVGCGGEQGELTEWMEQQKREVKPSVQPLSPPKKFSPQAYASLSGVEPFSNQKLTVALKQEARQPNSLLAAEVNRRKEPLEAYPLDSMSMVGSVVKAVRMPCFGSAACSIRSNRVTTWVRTSGRSPRSPRPTWHCGKSFRMQPANGSSAPAPSSFRRRRDEEQSGVSDDS